MSVHYKFKNTINYEPVKFDGLYISALDLKKEIIKQKQLGSSELQVENEETREIYSDDQQIPRNTNVIVSRIPSATSNKKARLANQTNSNRFSGNMNSSGATTSSHNNLKNGSSNNHRHHHNSYHPYNNNRHNPLNAGSYQSSSIASGSGADGGGREAQELVSTKNMSEEEKIKYIQSQSTKDFDPSRYARGGRGPYNNRSGPHRVPPGYTCRKCGTPGHFIFDCKSGVHKVKRSSGIPRDFLMKVDSKEKGALMTPSGEYAVPFIDREAYNNPKVEKAPFFEENS